METKIQKISLQAIKSGGGGPKVQKPETPPEKPEVTLNETENSGIDTMSTPEETTVITEEKPIEEETTGTNTVRISLGNIKKSSLPKKLSGETSTPAPTDASTPITPKIHAPSKIQLSAIKSQKKPEKKQETPVVTKAQAEQEDTEEKVSDTLTKADLRLDVEIEEKKETKLSREEIQKKYAHNLPQIIKPAEGEIFSQYTSEFIEKEPHIMEKIRKLKEMPRTRPLFVSSLVLVTIAGIGLLFYIDPGTHSLGNYKANLLQYEQNIEESIKGSGSHSPPVNTNEVLKETPQGGTGEQKPPEQVPKEDPQKQIQKEWQEDSLTIGGKNVSIELKTDEKEAKIYRYKETEYASLDELTEVIKAEQKAEKDKLKLFLKKGTS